MSNISLLTVHCSTLNHLFQGHGHLHDLGSDGLPSHEGAGAERVLLLDAGVLEHLG